MLLLIAIPVLFIILLIRRIILHHQLKADSTDNATLYREIGRLNKQVLDLMDEKNSILALKVNAMGGVDRIPYMGASALTEDTIPNLKNVTGNEVPAGNTVAAEVVAAMENKDPGKAPLVRAVIEGNIHNMIMRFHWKILQRDSVCLLQVRWDFITLLRLSEDLWQVWQPVNC